LEGLIIKKYLVMIFLIFGLTLSLSVYGVSAATVGTNTNTNSTLNNYQGTKTTGTIAKASSISISKSVSSSPKTIKVLIYNGHGAITSCVVGVETGLKYANSNNQVPGYRFSYSTTKKIRSSNLFKFNVLVMPGGISGIKYIHTISGSLIRRYVSSGHGYLGICAGAYSGSKHVSGMYNGWGVAPHVYCKHVTHEGNLKISITSSGSNLFGINGVVTLAHYNGPAMYAHGGSIVKFATYTDNTIGYKNYGAIVGDTYGKGRTVLSGPHPELQPKNPSILSRLIAWAAKINLVNGLPV
jgi:glutamine amidotransferase-like uncharacterized protein